MSKKENENLEEELQTDELQNEEAVEQDTQEENTEETVEAAESEEADKEEDSEEAPKKKSLFGKKEKKDPLKAKLEEIQDKYMRQVAEFDNFRKRTDKEKTQMFSQGEANVLEKMLPILDNFERGLSQAPEDESAKAFAEGMNMIYKQFVKQLEDLGVTPIEAVGKEFDPNLHNAVMQVDSEEVESGFVAQELQKGYMHHDTVLRHSMVAVAK
ncbi:MAG: nucleotide exchange factor GrpE [Lachnospiraceae bacterium]|nr:nucleotide exchange factor GrpE [Lachnospiraceae bacterium]